MARLWHSDISTRRWQVLAGVLCALALAAGATGVCWAWFDASVQTGRQELTAGSYDLTCTVMQTGTLQAPAAGGESGDSTAGAALLSVPLEKSGEVAPDGDGNYPLEENGIYTVTLTAAGDSTGYATLTVTTQGNDPVACRTEEIQAAEQGAAFQFHLVASAAGTLRVQTVWGIPATGESAAAPLAAGQWYAVPGGPDGFEAIAAPTVSTEETQEPAEEAPETTGTEGTEGDQALDEVPPADTGTEPADPGTTPPAGEEAGTGSSTGTATQTPDENTAKNPAGQAESGSAAAGGPETAPAETTAGEQQPPAAGDNTTARTDPAAGQTAAAASASPAVEENTGAAEQPGTAAPAQS